MMEREDQILKDELDTDPDLLNFDLDDDSLDEIASNDSEQEDRIIELVDVIKKGKVDPDRFGDTREFSHLFDEDFPPVEKETAVARDKSPFASDEEDEKQEDGFPAEEHGSTIEIQENDLIYDDFSSDDVFEVTAKDLIDQKSASLDAMDEIDLEPQKDEPAEDLTEIHEKDLQDDIPEVPLDELEKTPSGDIPAFESLKMEDEELSERDLEEVLGEAPANELDIDFETEDQPKAKQTSELDMDDIALEDELEKALEEAAADDEPEPIEETEKGDLKESLDRLFFDEEEEKPPLKTAEHKKPKEASAKSQPVKPASVETGKIELSRTEIEAMISKEIRAAMEKIAKETMTHAAEKFIGEAISSLKKSLESASE